MTPQERGREFEDELALEFGLDVVPGSGSQWHSKLDITGKGARWSLKYTEGHSVPLTAVDLYEAVEACEGIGADGSMPLWAIRMEKLFGVCETDFVLLRKEDFRSLAAGELELIAPEKPKAAQRKARAAIPALLRED